MIICQGCGQAFELPEGYSRSKIQCPGCGVICSVPAGTAREPARKPTAAAGARQGKAPTEEQAAGWLDESEPIPLEVEEPTRAEEPGTAELPTSIRHVERKPREMLVPCRRCGRMVRRQRECPSCDAVPEPDVLSPEPQPPEAPRVGLTPHSLELDELSSPKADTGAGEDSLYLLADRLLPRCPKCFKDMTEGAVLCLSCGFDLRTRKRVARNYELVQRSWETNLPLSRRLMWFGVGQGVHIFLALLSVSNGFGAWPFVVSWPLLTGCLAFLLGTYDRIELIRDARGRVKLTRTWRFCFVPLAPVVTDVLGFEGVTVGQWHSVGFLEWFVLFSLLPLGIIPSILWWYNAIHTPNYHVALARDHGHSDVYVYRGRSQEQMLEIADVLCRVAELRNVS